MAPGAPDWSDVIATRRIAWTVSLLGPFVLAALLWLGPASAERSAPMTLTGLTVSLLVLVCAYTDVRFHKIPNWATYSGFLWGLGINAAASAIDRWYPERSPVLDGVIRSWGTVGIGPSLLGGLACFGIMFLVYGLTGGGAGDVKLAAAIGALLGLRYGILVLFLTYVCAGVVLLAWTIWRHGPLVLLRSFWRQIGSVFLPLLVEKPSHEEQRLLAKPVPLGAFFAVATLVVLLGLQERLQ